MGRGTWSELLPAVCLVHVKEGEGIQKHKWAVTRVGHSMGNSPYNAVEAVCGVRWALDLLGGSLHGDVKYSAGSTVNAIVVTVCSVAWALDPPG